MVFKKNLSAAIKVAGKVLREHGQTVYLPFGSEYSIFLKNHSNVHARVSITVDGKNVLGNSYLLLDPNSSSDITRSIVNGNLSQGNAFKFIERSERIEQARGIQVDDGLIRIEYWFALPSYSPPPITLVDHHHYYHPPVFYRQSFDKTAADSSSIRMNAACSVSKSAAVSYSADASSNVGHVDKSIGVASAGITVPGSVRDQMFTQTSDFRQYEQNSEVLILQLMGQVEGALISNPVTVKTKKACVTCGHKNKSSANFCVECGTSLQIV